MELLVTLVIVGILAAIALPNYLHSRQQAFDREAQSYLQLLRQAARAYFEQWNSYPTSLEAIPQVMVPAADDASSHWIYALYLSSGATPWYFPTADRKSGGRRIQIQQDGTFIYPVPATRVRRGDD